MNRRWLVNRTNPEFLRYLSNKASISTTFAQILVNRGIKDPDAIKEFLNPSFDNLHDPMLLPDIKKAIERVKAAMSKGETVLIHGDYDADGLTSTALLVSAFRKLGIKAFYHIPNRETEGYGFGNTGVEKAKACGASLIITADCGISSIEAVASANASGIDVIITDHHEVPEKMPEAIAVIDPHRKDSQYPFKFLAGVGVAYKFVQALLEDIGTYKTDILPEHFLDLVALGTVADSVPLIGENRIFVAYGLKEINKPLCRIGIQAMKDAFRADTELHSVMLSFTLIPRINAAGRLSDAGAVVELLLTDDRSKADETVALLEEHNKKRQKIEKDVLESALAMIDPDKPGNAIVLASPDWHPGVIGIVASRLVDRFYRPVLLFAVKGSIAKGSARSIPPFNLYNGISECADHLIDFGGHEQAAGIKMDLANLPLFKEKINQVVGRTLSDEDMIPMLEIDAGVELSEINFNLLRELSLLEPLGATNSEPVLGAKGVEFIDPRIVGNNHLKVRTKQKKIYMDTIGFNKGGLIKDIEASSVFDSAFTPSINEWNGTKILQLKLKALRPGG
ncbi:MAG: single-stranded-DNA-specific exonuclease RecJ [Thermodesulfovibrionia bacterium]|nr:single-stranded-DNA-specific exonuclease RecJ [Thermodesulfovibrionia bacterium]